jgi:Trp operon repressor
MGAVSLSLSIVSIFGLLDGEHRQRNVQEACAVSVTYGAFGVLF